LQHFLTTITKARSLNSCYLQRSSQTVDNQSSQSFTINILSNDQQWTACLSCLLKNGQHILHSADLFVMDQDVRIVKFGFHLLSIGYKVRRDVATVKLHTFNNLNSCFSSLGFFYSDNTFTTNLRHSFGNQTTDFLVIVGRDLCNLFNLIVVITNFLSLLTNAFNNLSHSLVNTLLQFHWVCAGCHVLQTYINDSLSKNGSSSCTITCIITGLGSNFFNHLCTNICKSIFKFDFLCNCYTVLGYCRSTKFLFNNYIATLRTQCNLYGI